LCAERSVGGDPFAVLLADDFLTDYEPGVTADLAQAFTSTGKSQLSVMEVDGPDISKYGVVVPNGDGAGIAGLVEKPDADHTPSNLASIARYVLTPDIFETLRGLKAGSGGEIQLADAINIHARQGSVETVRLNGRRFDCGSVDGFLNAIMHQAKR
jgi:UTP--glucose-1-phosphate uridylyltransferase